MYAHIYERDATFLGFVHARIVPSTPQERNMDWATLPREGGRFRIVGARRKRVRQGGGRGKKTKIKDKNN